MIRVKFSDKDVQEFPNKGVARLAIMETLHLTAGTIKPVEAVDVMGVTMHGVSVEQPLNLRFAFIPELNGWMVAL